MAKTYRALYRQVAGWPLTPEDEKLLREATVVRPPGTQKDIIRALSTYQ
jgi:hypothetical protein